MRTKNVVLGCSLSLLLIASPREAAPEKENDGNRRSSGACTAIQVSSPDSTAAPTKRRARKVPAFSASQILDLQLSVLLSPAVKGDHQVELKLYTPNGHLYQSLRATATAAAPANQNRRREKRPSTATALLPVAGTTIVNSSLYGEWRVEAFLDGERETPCVRAQRFVIEP